MIDFGKELNSEQLRVVEQGDGPCLVLAGAGSGKTRTIIYRVAYLLEQGVRPENILLVTFTNKAAKEMIERVDRLTTKSTLPPFTKGGEDQTSATPPEPPLGKRGVVLPWSGTFHHIGYRILKKYAGALDYKNNFSVLDTDDSLELIKLCLKAEGIDRKERFFPSAKVLQSIISFARNAETTVAEVLDMKYPDFLPVLDTIERIADNYHQRKQESNVMDFDDLLVNFYLLLLKNPDIKNKYASQFEYVLVDEYQDTNKIQASIIDLLASKYKNILVVGDDAQSIYSFRAADINNILAFEKKYPGAKVFRLETNYRSTPNILDVANCVIANNHKQYEKNLKSVVKEFAKPEVNSFADQTEEADFIVQRILELQTEGVELSEIAVLFRAAYQSQALEMALVKNGIDYDYRGGVRFFERAHIKDVLGYLRILNNPEDAISWRRVLNMQIGIGPVAAEKIIGMIKTLPPSSLPAGRQGGDKEGVREEKINPTVPTVTLGHLPYEGRSFESIGAQLSAKAQIGWSDFLQVWEEMEKVIDKNPGNLIRAVIGSKYFTYLENEYPDYRERIQDLEQLAVYADRHGLTQTGANAEDNLNSFLAESTLQESFRRISDHHPPSSPLKGGSSSCDKIILSTIHQAKGLEWEAVFVIGLASGQFPNDRAVREQSLEEERRLFYVAITRAKKYLSLTYSLTGGFDGSLQAPSMFIDEIDADLILDNSSRSEQNVFSDDGEIEYIPDDDSPFDSGSFLKRVSDL